MVKSLYWLKKDISQIERQMEELLELEMVTAELIPDSDKLEKRLNKLRKRLELKVQQYVEVREETEEFIESIEDDNLRMIARLRLIDNLSYEQIGYISHYDKATVYRKVQKLLKEQSNYG